MADDAAPLSAMLQHEGVPVDATALRTMRREIAQMEEAIRVTERHAELRAELELRRISLPVMPTTMSDIAALVAARYSLTLEDLQGPRATREYAWPRQEAMWALYNHRNRAGVHVWSYPQVGRFLNRDHTTAMYGVRVYRARVIAAALDYALQGVSGVRWWDGVYA